MTTTTAVESTNIIKSQFDEREYRTIELPNKLKCLLVHDKKTDKSGASLDVKVGQFADPAGMDGLAHFLEHMLFLGTTKYPNQNDYSAYLNQNAGHSNAYTAHDHTNYYFGVANAALQGALERFSQFFINPLFTPELVDREVNAVNSEHQKNLNTDMWRRYQLLRSTSHPGTPYARFGTGCHETLQIPNIRDHVLDFYKKSYSANLMNLCVYGAESLDTLEKWVTELFSEIPNYNYTQQVFKDLPFDEKNLGSWVRIVPIKDEDKLIFFWSLENMRPHYRNNPLRILSHLIGHEGPGSILSILIDEGLATSLSSADENEMELFSTFTIEITLTKLGLQRYQDVIEYVFQYIQLLQKEKIPQYIHEEYKQVAHMKFLFKDKDKAEDEASSHATHMGLYPIHEILIADYLMDEFKPDHIQSIAQSLTTKNVRIALSSPVVKGTTTSVEHFYGIEYALESVSEKLRGACQNPQVKPQKSKKQLHLPPINPFIPTNFDLLPGDLSTRPAFPYKIFENDSSVVWHKLDNTFGKPKASAYLEIYTAPVFQDPVLDLAYFYLWEDCFSNFWKETSYMATLASVTFMINLASTGVNIYVDAFNSSYAGIFEAFVQKLGEFVADEDKFNMAIETVTLSFENQQRNPPYLQALQNFKYVKIIHAGFPQNEMIKAVRKANFAGYVKFAEELWRTLRFEWLVMGNITSEEVKRMVWTFEGHVARLRKNHEVLEKSSVREHRVIKLPPKGHFVHEKELILPTETNSAAISFYEVGPYVDTREQVLSFLAENYLQERAFNQLRTNEQLGYIVACRRDLSQSICSFWILVQSQVAPPHLVASRIEAFVDSTIPKVRDELTDDAFRTYVQSVTVTIGKKFLSIFEELQKYSAEIENHQYTFDKKFRQLAVLPTLTKDELIDFLERIFLSEKRVIEFHTIAPTHVKDNERLKAQRQLQSKHLQIVKSIESFQKSNELYPDKHSLT